ncbi:DMT family transporter [Planktomarina sp.]|jgi:drug/metabolite transporter (DMT)-like permease|nr:DMT family transporter [Planktomarina sp.]MDB4841744.1 DMT family transporter [Planktomarina sp.]
MHQSDDLQDQNTDHTAWIAFGFMTVCLSLSFVFVKLSLEGFTLEQAAGGRLVLGAAFLLPITYLLGDGLPLKFEFWKWAFILGMFNFVFPIGLTTYGLQTIPSNVVGSMYAMIPLITIGLSTLVLKVQISRQKFVGLIIGLVGLLAITEPASWIGTVGRESAFPMLATFGAVACLAMATILMRVMPKAHPISMIGGSALVASLFGIWPFLSVFEGELPSARPWLGLTGVSILSTAVAYSIRIFLIRRKGPIFLAPNAYFSIILTNVFGVLLLGDVITTPTKVAFVLIFVGLYLARDRSGYMKQV